MKKNFHEAFTEGEIELPSDRSTGIVFAVVALIAAYFLRAIQPAMLTALALSAAFAVVSFAYPSILRPLNIAWFRFSLLLNRIISPLVMGLIFFLVILPFGLMMRVWRDPLLKKPKKDRETYWIPRTQAEGENTSMKNQF